MKIITRIGPLKKYRKQIRYQLEYGSTGYVSRALKKWGSRYRRFLSKRYTRASHGSGIWRALKPATIARKGHSRILIDTGTLRKALKPNFNSFPGQLEQRGAGFLVVGFSSERHPKAKMPIDKLAEIHQKGLGRVPQRKIIVRPDRQTVDLMVKDMEFALVKVGKQTGVQP